MRRFEEDRFFMETSQDEFLAPDSTPGTPPRREELVVGSLLSPVFQQENYLLNWQDWHNNCDAGDEG